jgi:shikimate dehydrogenase/3-dehydroquinate dehydratase type I
MTYIVASLVERSIAGTSRSSKTAFREGADLVEVRLDHLTGVQLDERGLSEVRGAIDGPAIATLRSSDEGGKSRLRGKKRQSQLRTITGSQFEYVDLELETDKALINETNKKSARPALIASKHFQKPVRRRIIEDAIRKACHISDIGKVAMPCEDASQALMLAQIGRGLSAQGLRFVLLGMGEQGELTRVCAQQMGSSIVYACLPGKKAAPGQLDVRRQKRLMSNERAVLGLVGHPVSHSVSKPMQEAALASAGIAGAYLQLDIPRDSFDAKAVETLRQIGFSGLNVTIPHKRRAFEICDSRGSEAEAVEAVNTIKFNGTQVFGENTDVIGFSRMIEGKIDIDEQTDALLLGAGGAARAVATVLMRARARISVTDQFIERAEELAALVKGEAICLHSLEEIGRRFDIVVNCTPVGTRGARRKTINVPVFGKGTVYFDLVYNPPVTLMMKTARAKGAKTHSGLEMLVNQGAESFRIWTDQRPDVGVMFSAARRALR